VYPGVFESIVAAIGSLTMARYRPSAYERSGSGEAPDERALAGLMQSALLKRFESSVAAVRKTVDRLMQAHRALIDAWEQHRRVPSLAALRDLATEASDGEPLPALVEEALERDPGARPSADFRDEFLEDVRKDLAVLVDMERVLAELATKPDPKLARLKQLLTTTPARKVAVFCSFADTVRYVEEAIALDPAEFAGREMSAVIGTERDPGILKGSSNGTVG
jgi:hypothetical protein